MKLKNKTSGFNNNMYFMKIRSYVHLCHHNQHLQQNMLHSEHFVSSQFFLRFTIVLWEEIRNNQRKNLCNKKIERK